MKKIKLFALLLVVILNLMFVSSCWIAFYNPYNPDKAYESGHVQNDAFHRINTIVLKSDKNVFNINEVTLDLYINLDINRTNLDDPEYKFFDIGCSIPCYDNGSILTVPYSINYLFFEYKNLNYKTGISILKEGLLVNINSTDVVEGKYKGNLSTKTYEYEYVYNEFITIPSECFDKESGEFCIGVKIDYLYSTLVYFRYNKLEENTIQIEFQYENYKSNNNINSTLDRCIDQIKQYYLDEHEKIDK